MKLTKEYNQIDKAIISLETKLETLELKIDDIEQGAIDSDRDLTAREIERIDEYEELISDIRASIECLQDAQDNISYYAD